MTSDASSTEGRSKGSHLLPNLLLLIGSIVVFCMLAEGAARAYYWSRWGHKLYPIQMNAYTFPLGWSLAPGRYFTFSVDSFGFRGSREFSLKPDSGVVRIVLVGGSTAFGTNGLYPQVPSRPLGNEDTIDRELESVLAARHPGRRFEVINAGVPEYRVSQELTLFREKLTSFQPALAIFLDGHNDISFLLQPAASFQDPTPYWRLRHYYRAERVLNGSGLLTPLYFADIYLGRSSYAYHALSMLLQGSVDRMGSGRPASAGQDAAGPEPFRPDAEAALLERNASFLADLRGRSRLYLDQVRDLRAVAGSRRVPILYVLQPEIMDEAAANLSATEKEIQSIAFRHHRVLGALTWRTMARDLPDSLGALVTDGFHILPLSTIADRDTTTLYTDYCHLTRDGNRVVAEAMAPEVERILGLGGIGKN